MSSFRTAVKTKSIPFLKKVVDSLITTQAKLHKTVQLQITLIKAVEFFFLSNSIITIIIVQIFFEQLPRIQNGGQNCKMTS